MTRRELLSTVLLGASASARAGAWRTMAPGQQVPRERADVTLRIGTLTQQVAPGHLYTTTAYNGSVPGPIIRLREGVPATIEVINDTDVEEFVHWHGLGVPSEIDGTEEQRSWPVPARGSLRYTLTPRETGSRFVHSHAMAGAMHGAHAARAALGAGPYSGQFAHVYVEPRREPGAYDQEVFLATHEWGPEMIWAEEEEDESEASFQQRPPLMPVGMYEIAYDIGSINGRALFAGEPVRVREGTRVMFRVLNASATATVHLAFAGHQFLVTALDGNPVPTPRLVDVIRLGAAERVDAIVEMKNPGVWILGAAGDDDRTLGRMGIVVEYAGAGRGPVGVRGSAEPRWIAPARQPWDYTQFGLRPTDQAPLPPEPTPDETRPYVIEMLGPLPNGMEAWTINGQAYDQAKPWRFAAGGRYRIVFDNRSDDEHPMHLHRHSFELKRVNDKPTRGLVKDTVIVPAFGTVEVEFVPDRTQRGLALMHCHQQMHMENGFKTLFNVT